MYLITSASFELLPADRHLAWDLFLSPTEEFPPLSEKKSN